MKDRGAANGTLPFFADLRLSKSIAMGYERC